ncbi:MULTISPECIES: Nudix family hydrolase [Dyella]|nr:MULTISPECIES: Nudix family hydrolase [Dyella]
MSLDRTHPAIHVLAGVMVDGAGKVLLAQRPPGKHLAGAWEFPGGKREPGEAPLAALARELHEELGILLQGAEPLIRVPWQYDDKSLLLDAWIVRAWANEPASLDGQALRWSDPWSVDIADLAPADRAILQALRLPATYAITPADIEPVDADFVGHLVRTALERGERMIQLRLPRWLPGQVRALAAAVLPDVRLHRAHVLLNGDIEGALALGDGVGVHLPARLARVVNERPLPWGQLVAASCHDADELAHATAIGADFATLSPVASTPSHPGSAALGWDRFQQWLEGAALPVYALGGMRLDHVNQARSLGAQGVAGIRGFWHSAA